MKKIIAVLLIAFAVFSLHSDAGAFSHGKAVITSGGQLLTDSGFSPPNTLLTTDSGDPLLAE